MKKGKLFAIAVTAAFLAAAGILLAQTPTPPSTEKAQSLTDGLHIGQKTTDRIGFFNATPIAQPAATLSPFQVLVNLGLVAPGNDYGTLHATRALSSNDIKTMYTTPIQIVAGVFGKTIALQKAILKVSKTSTGYTGGGATVLQYGATVNGAGTNAADSTLAASVFTGTSVTGLSTRNGAVISNDTANVLSAGLYISNDTAVFATGTGTATLDVFYLVQ